MYVSLSSIKVLSKPFCRVLQLFPRWRGGFDGSRPSLAGLEGDRIIGALEGGLLTEQEICGLLFLIREPDVGYFTIFHSAPLLTLCAQSHFLKVPSLPFHSLISLLSKFPADVDSRVFWSTSVRDLLLGKVCVFLSRNASCSCTIHLDATYS